MSSLYSSSNEDPCGGYAMRPIAWMNFAAPQPRVMIHLAIDWRDEMRWLREMLSDADACDAWENEGGR